MKFIEGTNYDTKEDVCREYPQYEIVEEVEGGYMIFATADEYWTWTEQA